MVKSKDLTDRLSGFPAFSETQTSIILLLTKPALTVLRDYEKQKKEGKDPVFDTVKLGIKDADFWEKEYQYIEHVEGNRDKA
ncbi:hypothetical protein ASG81_11655 [Paenibacillus sp. Soil522]|nr:hypothetical protein ASG81_11655 [Paenibacillus sp. Soil522]